MARTTPYRHKVHSKSPKSSSKTWNKSPLRFKINSGDVTRGGASRPLASTARTSRTRNLPPIREEGPSPVRRRSNISNPYYRNFNLNEDTYHNETYNSYVQGDEEDDGIDPGDSFFHWEEESTLFSDLMDEASEDLKDHNVESLVDSLQDSFNLHGKELKKEIAETLVPTVNHVKALYQVLDENVDASFAKGIIVFNKACKETEAMAIKEQDDSKHFYLTVQRNIEGLLNQLKDAYARRDKLWSDFEKAVNDNVEPTLESLKDLPVKVERTIASFERHAKNLEKEDNGLASTAEQKVKGLLGKIS